MNAKKSMVNWELGEKIEDKLEEKKVGVKIAFWNKILLNMMIMETKFTIVNVVKKISEKE